VTCANLTKSYAVWKLELNKDAAAEGYRQAGNG
jgi:hypothetical protein